MKNVINLTENELENIVFESVKRIVNEISDAEGGIDISKIDIEDLKKIYIDYRLIPQSTHFDNVLYSPSVIKEAFGYIFPPDEVVENLINKYNIPISCIKKKEVFNKIFIYIVNAVLGVNDKLIEEDMSKMGYFLGYKGKIQNIQGMQLQVLQFEPSSQIQDDETENIKTNYKFLYHWTPSYNLNEIFENGLLPSAKNSVFNYPSRIYFMRGDSDNRYMLGLGQQLCTSNDNPKNNGEYALLSVNIENIEESVRFYYDPNSEMGIYTEQPINKNRVNLVNIIQFIKNINDKN